MLLGIATRPERRDVLRGLGEFLLAMACSMIVFGYLIPVQLLPAIDNGVWTQGDPAPGDAHAAVRARQRGDLRPRSGWR